jgi:outer membrane cobalamin receptor
MNSGASVTALGLKAAYRPMEPVTIELGTTNLMDRDYVIEDGYNGPGRECFVNVRMSY